MKNRKSVPAYMLYYPICNANKKHHIWCFLRLSHLVDCTIPNLERELKLILPLSTSGSNCTIKTPTSVKTQEKRVTDAGFDPISGHFTLDPIIRQTPDKSQLNDPIVLAHHQSQCPCWYNQHHHPDEDGLYLGSTSRVFSAS